LAFDVIAGGRKRRMVLGGWNGWFLENDSVAVPKPAPNPPRPALANTFYSQSPLPLYYLRAIISPQIPYFMDADRATQWASPCTTVAQIEARVGAPVIELRRRAAYLPAFRSSNGEVYQPDEPEARALVVNANDQRFSVSFVDTQWGHPVLRKHNNILYGTPLDKCNLLLAPGDVLVFGAGPRPAPCATR
jgi:hypothetical protein